MAPQRRPVQARVAELVLRVQQGLFLLTWPVCKVAEDALDDFWWEGVSGGGLQKARVGGGGGQVRRGAVICYLPKLPLPVAMWRHVDLPPSRAAIMISAGDTPSRDDSVASDSFRSATSPARAK